MADYQKYYLISPDGKDREELNLSPDQVAVVSKRALDKGWTFSQGEGQGSAGYAPSLLEQVDEGSEQAAAFALGDVESRTAGVGDTALLLALGKRGVPRTQGRGINAPLMPERTALQEAERVKGEHPVAAGVGRMTGYLGPGAFNYMVGLGKKAAGAATGKLAGAGVLGTAAAGEQAIKQTAQHVGEAIEGREPTETPVESLARTMIAGTSGGLGGFLLPSSVGLAYKGPGRLDRPPIAQMMAAGRKGGGSPSVIEGWKPGPQTEADIMEGARTGVVPSEIAAGRMEQPMAASARRMQVAEKEGGRKLMEEYYQSPAGKDMLPATESTKTLWRIAREAVHEDPAAAGKTMSMHDKQSFVEELDKVTDINFALKGEATTGKTLMAGRSVTMAGDNILVPIADAEAVLGGKKLEEIAAKNWDELPDAVKYRTRVSPEGKETKEAIPPEELFDMDSLVLSPYKLRAQKLEQISGGADNAAKAAKKLGQRVDLWEDYAAATKADREKYRPGPAVGERSITNPEEATQKEVTGWPARMHNIHLSKAAQEKQMTSAGLPTEIGRAGLTGGESQAFRSALKGAALGENAPAAESLQAIASSAQLGPELDRYNAVLADLALSKKLQGEGNANRLIMTGTMPHFFGSFGWKDTMALRTRALEEAVNSMPKLKVFLKGLRQAGTRGAIATADTMTEEDWRNLEQLSQARLQSKEQVK